MIWVHPSDQRILPTTAVGDGARELALSGARGQVVSFQVGVRPDRLVRVAEVSLAGPLARAATVRLAGLVPLPHHTPETPAELLDGRAPGFVPDPLLPGPFVNLDPDMSRAFVVTLRLPERAGRSTLRVRVRLDDAKAVERSVGVTVYPFTLPELTLPVTNWFYSDALCDWYGVEPFSPRYWELVGRYFANMAAHNQTAIYTPLFTPPLDDKKRDLQLVDVTAVGHGRYRFGFAKVRKWLDLARGAGFRYFEMSHLFTQWGAAHAIRILVKNDGKVGLLCPPETPATARVYREFLGQFLPALLTFLRREGVLERCVFHLSDEPNEKHLGQYRAVREMVRAIAPEIRVTEALSHVEFMSHGLVDQPVPVISALPDFLKGEASARPWTYYCCVPRGTYPNRFLDYPLHRLRVLGTMLFKFDVGGFLHWGCNYWYRGGTTELIDPYHVTDAHRWPGWSPGDPFVVYPGADGGPVDSLRWESFRETLDDYRLLTLAAKRAGREAVVGLLAGIRSPAEYPQEPAYLREVRARATALVLRG